MPDIKVEPAAGGGIEVGPGMSEPTWAEQHTLRADADPAITDAQGRALPVILQMAADTEAEVGQ
jgi:hypothetical protein